MRVTKLLIPLFILLLSSSVLAFPKAKTALNEIKLLYEAELYQEIYSIYLAEIPQYNSRSKYDELIFYYLIRTCINLGYYDEAEGYLYQLQGNTRIFKDQKQYDYLWGVVWDFQGKYEKAYRQFLFIAAAYDSEDEVTLALLRLGQLATKMGRFDRAKHFYNELEERYPSSPQLKQLNTSDDRFITGYTVSFGEFYDREEAKSEIQKLKKKGINLVIHQGLFYSSQTYSIIVPKPLKLNDAKALVEEYANQKYTVFLFPRHIPK